MESQELESPQVGNSLTWGDCCSHPVTRISCATCMSSNSPTVHHVRPNEIARPAAARGPLSLRSVTTNLAAQLGREHSAPPISAGSASGGAPTGRPPFPRVPLGRGRPRSVVRIDQCRRARLVPADRNTPEMRTTAPAMGIHGVEPVSGRRGAPWRPPEGGLVGGTLLALTVSVTGADVLPLKPGAPRYTAVMMWTPGPSVDVVKVA